jgi:hypothetical protein
MDNDSISFFYNKEGLTKATSPYDFTSMRKQIKVGNRECDDKMFMLMKMGQVINNA